MNRKKFEYYVKDIKPLKKDIIYRCCFALLMLATVIWQTVLLVNGYMNSTLNNIRIIIAGIVIFTGVMVFLVLLLFIFRDYRIIGTIKATGKCASSVNILFNTDKGSFLKLYELLMGFLSLSTSLVLISGITYSILEVAYLSSISFFMPMLLVICLSSFSALYTIHDEVRTQQTVQEQSPLY